MAEEMKKCGCFKGHKKSILTTIISALLLVIFIVLAVVFANYVPKNNEIVADDGTAVTSIATYDKGLLYTTSGGHIYTLDNDNKVISTFDIKDQMIKNGKEITEIKNIYLAETQENVWVYAINNSEGFLIQFGINDGVLTYKTYDYMSGTVYSVTEDDGYVYIVNAVDRYRQVRKYEIENINAGYESGYIYKSEISNGNVRLTLMYDPTIFAGDIVEVNGEKVFNVFTEAGLIEMSTDFTLNMWENLPSEVNEKYEELYTEALQTVPVEEIDKTELKNQAKQEIYQSYESVGLINYNEKKGYVDIDISSFDEYTYNFYLSGTLTFRGAAYDRKANTYYLLTGERELYSLKLKDVENKENCTSLDSNDYNVVENVTLAERPKSTGNALIYDKGLNIAYVLYDNSQTVSCIDLNSVKIKFSSAMNFDIKSIQQSFDKKAIYYTYTNVNETTSGSYILRKAYIAGQSSGNLFNVLKILSIVFAAFCGVVIFFGCLCIFKKGFAEKFVKTMKEVRANWKIYAVMIIPFVLLFSFCYYPAIGSIRLSFFDYTKQKPSEIWNNFNNYVTIFTSKEALQDFVNMVFYLLFDLIKGIVPPLLFGFFLTIMRNKKYSGLVRTLLFIPGIIPGVAVTLIWKTGIFGSYGVVNTLIKICNGTKIDFLHDTAITKWTLVIMGFPYVGAYLIFYGALMNIPDSYYEAAELEGISIWRRLFEIDIPLIFAQIKYIIITTTIASVQNFGRTYMVMSGQKETYTPIHRMYNYIASDGNYGMASAYATILFILLFGATVLNFKGKESSGGDD